MRRKLKPGILTWFIIGFCVLLSISVGISAIFGDEQNSVNTVPEESDGGGMLDELLPTAQPTSGSLSMPDETSAPASESATLVNQRFVGTVPPDGYNKA